MTTCKEEMLEIATRYYTQLLNVCNEELIDQVAFRNIINRIPRKVMARMMDRLHKVVQELMDFLYTFTSNIGI